ncbi:MAG: anaerobic ribonucleoside-triphosphate reductase [Promethearchaeota archaeon]
MDPDKNNNFLEKQLKALGQKIRRDILKKLKISQDPLTFSKLQKEVLESEQTSVNFSFHLNALKSCELINSTKEGYYITKLGNQILDKILSIEQILTDKTKTRMIRTSKYSKELFDFNKVEKYLIIEGELEGYLARQIAQEVEERLAKINIEYLTAPLMREFINAILLENGLEEVRHKLTRLGTPPFEVSKLFNSRENEITPEIFINKLGSDVSEQFLLLNLLPKNLADLYLSGEIALLNLNYWSLRPLSIYLNTEKVLEYLSNSIPNIPKQIQNSEDLIILLLEFFNFLYQFKQFCSEDIVLGDFTTLFLNHYKLLQDRSKIIDLLISQILKLNNNFQNINPLLTLEINTRNIPVKNNSLLGQSIKEFLNSLKRQQQKSVRPLLLVGYSDFATLSTELNIIDELTSQPLINDVIFFKNNLLNSTVIKLPDQNSNRIILDKILINLHMISIEANQNDDLFFDLLLEKLKSVFELFKIKENLVKKKLHSVKTWNKLTSTIFSSSVEKLFEDMLKSISFFGLNKAILNHCGLELDRMDSSTSFALNVLTFIKKIIEEQNNFKSNNYVLTQPHNDLYLNASWHNDNDGKKSTRYYYSSRIIREDCSLSLNKKLNLFKKFENVLDGGSLFNQKINAGEKSLNRYLNVLPNSKINAFSLWNH